MTERFEVPGICSNTQSGSEYKAGAPRGTRLRREPLLRLQAADRSRPHGMSSASATWSTAIRDLTGCFELWFREAQRSGRFRIMMTRPGKRRSRRSPNCSSTSATNFSAPRTQTRLPPGLRFEAVDSARVLYALSAQTSSSIHWRTVFSVNCFASSDCSD